MTANQVAAYVAKARAIRGWTQEEAAEALAPYLGTRWSVASFSAVERSVDRGRIRRFSADQLLALSRGFDLPIAFFLIPPPTDQIRLRTAASHDEHPQVLLDAVLGTPRNLGEWERVLVDYCAAMAPSVRPAAAPSPGATERCSPRRRRVTAATWRSCAGVSCTSLRTWRRASP